MKKNILFFLTLLLSNLFTLSAQEYFNSEAEKYIKGTQHIRYTEFSELPDYVKMKPGNEIPSSGFVLWARKVLFENDNSIELLPYQTNKDELGYTHTRYQQHYKGIPVEGAVLNTHSINGRVISFNGRLAGFSTADYQHSLNESTALNFALAHVNAESYKWEIEEEEKYVHEHSDMESYFPKGNLVWISDNGNFKSLRKAWKFNIYAHQPLYRAEVYVDAVTGAILFENNLIHHADANGTAVTGYSGTKPIVADSFGGSYRLREAGRSGVQTYNMQRGTNYGNAVDFTDGDNYWNNVNANLDQYATDAHWGAEMTYDYYLNVHNRNSINGNGMIMRSYVHYDANYFNAFWDGQRVTYGDGDSNNPLVSLDICGHEFTHGVTGFTAGLVYQNQSGALNESFSDIFGAAIEFYTTPGSADWLMGEDIGATLRSMSNPNAYGDPDTYNGTNWYTGTGDNGGVHTNSGVQNHWFYRLTVGGTGTNDIGNAFNVTAIGITDAARIAYRNLTVYLGSNSNYADARFYAIQAAIDLFGPCTQQVISTTNAWYAVGVGAAFNGVVTADFTANLTAACTAPFTVTFTNQSTNGGSFSWNFGDGNTSTATSPTHTYTNFGTYTVTLTATGGSCGSDTEVKTNFISIDANNPCIAILPASGTGQTQTSCQGTMYDNGGPNANYVDQADVVMTIAPPGASSVSINFTSFSFESGYDYVYVYNGPTTASPLLGQYSGSTLPNGGNVISSTTGSITIRQTSDQNLNYPGFSLNWACVIPNSPPLVNFAATPVTSCSGTIAFTDNSIPTPTSWLWDFGDGSTSTQQNPTHTYTADGTYTITLTSTNNFGSNTLVRTALVTVDKPSAPNVTPGFRCNPGTITLAASALSGGTLSWYADPTGGSAIATGTTYTTPVLINTTNYYVEESIPQPSQNVGPANNSIGAGGNFNGTQSLLFDAYTPFTLVSVLVYANGAGNRTIELRNSGGTVLQSITVNIPNGTSRVTLNLNVPAGNSLQLGVTANANLYRNSAGAVFPYTIPGTVSITGSTAGGAFYYSFYDWEIVKPNCISERAQITATINAEPTVTDASRCGSGSVALTAAGAADLNWYDAVSGGNLVNTGTTFNTPALNSTTTYYVGSDVVTPSLYVGPADNNFGDGGNFTGNQHLKFNCTSNFTLVSVKVYAQGAGNRTIELRNSGGAVLQTLTANIPTGESRVTLNFNITPGTQYQLAINGTPNLYRNSNNAVYPYTLPGVVSITGSSAGVAGYYYFFYDWEIRQPGCSTARVPVTATINPLPEVSVSNDQNSCAGDEVILNASGIVGDLVWLPGGETTTSISINPTSTSTYTASATNSCGTATDDVTVTIIPEPAVTVSNDQSLCAGNSVTLDASGIEGTIVWSPGGETSTSITVNPTSQTTYTATATNTCGSASDAVTVTVNPLPAVTASADENSCAGDAVTLSASGVTGNLLWSPGGATTASITVSPTSSQTYTVMASNSCGTVSDAVDVNVTPLPAVTASSDQSVCAGAMVTLGTSGAVGNLVWMPGGETTSSITVSPTENTTYTVTASNSCGSVSETIEVTIGTTPSVDAGADAAICQGESITLSASGSGTFLWLPGGETTSSITVNPLTMQTYTVSAVSSCGTATDNVTVNVNSAEIPVITDNGGILVSSPASSYQWYFNFTAITGANNQEYTPSEEGIYSVEITDANGCSAYSEDYVFTTTGILAASDLTFKVYPNPNYGVFTIACTSIVSDIMIYNALGELVKTSASNSASGNITIDISNVEAGVYFVEARTAERNFVERVVVGN